MRLKLFFLICLLSVGFNAHAQTARSKTEPVKAGEIAPDFTLPDQNGNQVRLSKLNQPVMLIFYRGWW